MKNLLMTTAIVAVSSTAAFANDLNLNSTPTYTDINLSNGLGGTYSVHDTIISSRSIAIDARNTANQNKSDISDIRKNYQVNPNNGQATIVGTGDQGNETYIDAGDDLYVWTDGSVEVYGSEGINLDPGNGNVEINGYRVATEDDLDNLATKEDLANKTSLVTSGTHTRWNSPTTATVSTSTDGISIAYDETYLGVDTTESIELTVDGVVITSEGTYSGSSLEVHARGTQIDGNLTVSGNLHVDGEEVATKDDVTEVDDALYSLSNFVTDRLNPLTEVITNYDYTAYGSTKGTAITTTNTTGQESYITTATGYSASDAQNVGRSVIEATGDNYNNSASIVVKGKANGDTSINLSADKVSVNGEEVVTTGDLSGLASTSSVVAITNGVANDSLEGDLTLAFGSTDIPTTLEEAEAFDAAGQKIIDAGGLSGAIDQVKDAKAHATSNSEAIADLSQAIDSITTANGTDGIDGVDGLDGTDGLDGRDGVDGKDGINGLNGVDGIDGVDGNDGLNGLDGIDGQDGKDGINGTDGIDGADGKDGINGTDGINGVDGKDGVNGQDGRDGIDGKDGVNGVDGTDGIDGKDGVNGKDGIDGEDGKDGINGQDGRDGVDGVDGKDGVDGAKGDKGDRGEQGIQGLQGDKGDKGDRGEAGTDGKDGIDGTNGRDGVDGKDGVDGQDGRDGVDGVDGKDGRDGVDGKDGKDGVTTVITESTVDEEAKAAIVENAEAIADAETELDNIQTLISNELKAGNYEAVAELGQKAEELDNAIKSAQAANDIAFDNLNSRINSVSTKVEQNSAAILQNTNDIRSNTAAIKQNTAAIAGVAAQVSGLSALGGKEGIYAGTASTNGTVAIAVGIQKSLADGVTFNFGASTDGTGSSVTVSAGIGFTF